MERRAERSQHALAAAQDLELVSVGIDLQKTEPQDGEVIERHDGNDNLPAEFAASVVPARHGGGAIVVVEVDLADFPRLRTEVIAFFPSGNVTQVFLG